ncbi:MAG TPA: hypothetical protein GX707_12415 [Epulopiscium sp.]|nr:hypothetical protein [Candidatus Epulonipiscium sp.]
MGTSKGYLPPTTPQWRKAKSSLTSFMKSKRDGGDGRKEKAVGNYAKAHSSGSSYSAIGKAGAKIVVLFNAIAEKGLEAALAEFGLSGLIGQDTEKLYNGLINYFSDEAGEIEDAIVRDSLSQLFIDLKIDTAEDLRGIKSEDFLMSFIIRYIQVDFKTMFFEKILSGRSIAESKSIIKDIGEYIEYTIRDNYTIKDIAKIDWHGEEGKEFVSAQCRSCYSLLQAMGGE